MTISKIFKVLIQQYCLTHSFAASLNAAIGIRSRSRLLMQDLVVHCSLHKLPVAPVKVEAGTVSRFRLTTSLASIASKSWVLMLMKPNHSQIRSI